MSQASVISNDSEVQAPRIAIIGLPGAGKTVLTVVLAKQMAIPDEQGVFLEPRSARTLKFVETNWQSLQDGEWPAMTSPGEVNELLWILRAGPALNCPVRLADLAGQDLRSLFADDGIADLSSLPSRLREIAEYCRSAEIVLILVNLRNFVGESDAALRAEHEAVIKVALDDLYSPSRRICLVVTQADLYEAEENNAGGWGQLISEHLPNVSAAYLTTGSISWCPVAAVYDTEPDIRGGVRRRVPMRGFNSANIDWLGGWLKEQVADIQQQRMQSVQPTPATAVVPLPTHHAILQTNAWAEWFKRSGWRFWYGGIGLLVLLIVAFQSCGESRDIAPTPKTELMPKAVLLDSGSEDRPGIFDDAVWAWFQVRNDGAGGNIDVVAAAYENGLEIERQTQRQFLNAGQSGIFNFNFDKVHDVKHPHEIECAVSPK